MVVNAASRLSDPKYKNEFYVEGNKLFCSSCNTVVDFIRKSTIDNHLNSERHLSLKRSHALSKDSIVALNFLCFNKPN